MKRYLVIFIIAYLFPIFGHSTTGQQIYIYPITYTITKDVVVYSSNSYALGEVMVGINNGWTNGNASGNVTINRTIKYNNYNYTVGRLGKWAFRGNTQMTSISIPNTIKTIEDEAFLNCTSLRNVTINPYTNYNSISSKAFSGCESLETVEFNGSTLYVAESAFSGCKKLQSFPFDKVPSINNYSFSGCEALSSISLNTKTIGEGAFADCTSLTSVTFNSNKVSIGNNAFNGCEKLKSVTCFMDKENFTSLPSDNCFSGINSKAVLYVLNGMVSYYENDANWHAAFPNVKVIAPSLGETFSADIPVGNELMKLMFEVTNVENMEVVIISSESNINPLVNLTLPSEISYQDWHFSISGIRTSALTNLQNLHSLNVGWRYPVDAANNFDNIPNDAVLYVPAGTKHRYEANETWQNFSQIIEVSPISVGDISTLVGTNVVLPIVLNNQEEIEGVQFRLTLPNGVFVEMEDGNLKTTLTDRTDNMIVMGQKDPDSDNSYIFLLFSLNGSPIAGNEGAILNVNLEIDPEAKAGKHDMMIEDIHMTTSTYSTEYPDAARSELLLSTNVRTIEFADAEIKSLCVSRWDLNGDEELDTREAAAVTNLEDVFQGNKDITSFDELQYFTGLLSIGECTFSNCTSLVSISIPSNVTRIDNDIFSGCTTLSSIIIPDNVTTIGNGAFDGCIGLTSIHIPDNVTIIGNHAFADCTGLTTINIPSNVTLIDDDVFSGCSNLTYVAIPSSVTSIGSNAFVGCKSLISLEIPNTVTCIGANAFSGCYGLTTLNIPNSVSTIGEGAFEDCYGLNSIIVDENNTNYDSRDNCNAIIETVTNTLIRGCVNTVIPNSITAIGKGAFKNVSELTKLMIPNRVTSIGENAFNGCNKLKVVKLKNTTPITINANVFSNRSNASLYVPIGSVDDYVSHNSWNTFNVIKGYPDGDVNQDGETDVADVVDIARYVVSTPRTAFDENLADLNYDDQVNVADAVVLVNVIAGDTNWSRAMKMSQDNYNDLLFLTENEDHTLSLQLDGSVHYVAFQFDLTLPADVDVAEMHLNSLRNQKHQLIYNKVREGLWRVIALSTSNREFKGSSGELLNVSLGDFASDNVQIDNIHFVTAKGIDITFAAISLSKEGKTTGIHPTSTKTGHQYNRIYNLNGQHLDKPQKHLNIIDGKKVIMK